MASGVAFALAAVLLAGCQSNPEPPPFESASDAATPTATASPADAAPTLPPEAKGTSEASAKAFVRHYIALINHAVATGDTSPLEASSGASCESCTAIINRVRTVYQDGGSITSSGWRITSIQAVPAQPKTRPAFDVGLDMSPQRVIERKWSTPTTYDGGRLPATFVLVRGASGWRVQNWERAA